MLRLSNFDLFTHISLTPFISSINSNLLAVM